MSMYLPNEVVHATGFEPAEFIDIPPMADASVRRRRAAGASTGVAHGGDGPATDGMVEGWAAVPQPPGQEEHR